MLHLSRSPIRPAPTPPSHASSPSSLGSSSPEEASPAAHHSAPRYASVDKPPARTSPDDEETRALSFIERFLIADDSEAERDYFSAFRLGPHQPVAQPASPTLLHDTSSDDDFTESDGAESTSPNSRDSPGRKGRLHVAHESVSEEIADVEAKIRALRHEAWVAAASAAVPDPSTVQHQSSQLGINEGEHTRGNERSDRPQLNLKPPPPLTATTARAHALPRRRAPFRFPSHSPAGYYSHMQLGPSEEDEEKSESRVDAVVDVSSVSSLSSSRTHTSSSSAVSLASQLSSGTAQPGAVRCSPPPGEQVERALDFRHERTLSPDSAISAGRPPRRAGPSQLLSTPASCEPRRRRHDGTSSPTPASPRDFLSLSPLLRGGHQQPPAAGTATHPLHTVEVELEPGEVVSVVVRPGDTAAKLAQDFIAAHCLDAGDAAVREVLMTFFAQHAPASSDGGDGAEAVALQKAETSAETVPAQRVPEQRASRDEAVAMGHNALVAAAAPPPRATSEGQAATVQRSAAAQELQRRAQSLPRPLASGQPIRHTKASRLLAEANAHRQEAILQEKRRNTVAEFFDPYMMPPAPRQGKVAAAKAAASDKVPPPPSMPHRRREASRPRVPSSVELEVAQHCALKPHINRTSQRMFAILQEKGLPPPQETPAAAPRQREEASRVHTGSAGWRAVRRSPTAQLTFATPSPRPVFASSDKLSPSPSPRHPPGQTPSVEDRLTALGERRRERLYIQRELRDTTDAETGRQLFSPFLGR